MRDNGGMPIKNGTKGPVKPVIRQQDIAARAAKEKAYLAACIPPERLAAATTVPYDFPASDRRRKIADMARRMCEIDGALSPEEAFAAATDFVDYEARWMAQQQGK